MRFSPSPLALALLPIIGLGSAAKASDSPMEVLVVRGSVQSSVLQTSPEATAPKADISGLLKSLPGANVNSNGPLTGIAQYRGLFGDRVETQVGGMSMAGAGPNAMDTPLSYAVPVITEQLELDRGIAPVASGVDTLGGSIRVVESQARFDEVSGLVSGQYQHNGEQSRIGVKSNFGGERQALMLYGDLFKGNDAPESGDNHRLLPGVYDKQVFGGEYRFNLADSNADDESIAFSFQHLETTDAATPALPMDIDYIRTDRFKLSGEHLLADWQTRWHLGYSDARHGMDNFSLRMKMPTMAPRYTIADSKSFDGHWQMAKDSWEFGLDWRHAEHDTVVTDPSNSKFRVDNFNGVNDSVYSLYAQWQQDFGRWSWQLGSRVKHYRFDADPVSHSMAAMKPAIKTLMDRFNQADRSQNDTGLDLVINGRFEIDSELDAIIGLARKQASASYQQRYLWVPMQSTGGLADGRTYVGQMDLELETAWQLELGLDLHRQDFNLTPRVFVQRIDNYIQGLPTDDPAVIAAGDANTLVFSNTDALLYGMDVNAHWQLHEQWSLDLQAAYTYGERRDVEDKLYRIAPPNLTLGLNWDQGSWFARLETVAVAAQDKVSATQLEQETAGYGLVNLAAGYRGDSFMLKAGVDNLLDREYVDHLAGYNRVMGGDIAVGERLPQPGLNAWVMGEYRF